MNPSFEICMAKNLALALGFPCKAQNQFPYNGKTLGSAGKLVEWMLCNLGGREKMWLVHQAAAFLYRRGATGQSHPVKAAHPTKFGGVTPDSYQGTQQQVLASDQWF